MNPIVREVTIGPCRLIQGDCLNVLPLIGRVDAVVTSPPYNCGKDYGDSGDSLEITEYWEWLENVIRQSVEQLHVSGYLCLNHGNFIGSRESRVYVPDEITSILSRTIPFVDHIIWDKGPPNGAAWGNFRTSPRIRAQHENIWVHGGAQQMLPSDIEWDEWSAFTQSIWRVPTKGVVSTIHPAMMPVEIPRRLAKLYSPARGQLLDPFMGSGTTGVACIRTGRQFIGIEKEPKYFDIAVKRIQQAWDLKCSELPFEAIEQPKQAELFEAEGVK